MTDASPDPSESGRDAPREDGRKARGAKSRAHILEHAAAIASTDGLEGLTIGRLALEAGVAKGNIQVLFGGKEALQLATIDWVGRLYDATIVAPALAESSPLKRLRAMVENWFAFVEQRQLRGGCFMNAVASEFRARPGGVRDEVAERRLAKRRRYAETLRQAKGSGEIGAHVDVDGLAFELLAFQALASVAFTIGDDADFASARAMSRKLIDAAAAAGTG